MYNDNRQLFNIESWLNYVPAIINVENIILQFTTISFRGQIIFTDKTIWESEIIWTWVIIYDIFIYFLLELILRNIFFFNFTMNIITIIIVLN